MTDSRFRPANPARKLGNCIYAVYMQYVTFLASIHCSFNGLCRRGRARKLMGCECF